MALEDIDGLSEEINENQTGHIDDHKKIVRGLKSVQKLYGPKSNSIVLLGNSRIARELKDGAPWQVTDLGIFTLANAGLKNRFNVVNYAGISGQSLTQFIARFQTDVAAFNPDYVLIADPVNDATSNQTAIQMIDNMKTLINMCKNIGAIPIVLTAPPSDAHTAAQRTALNDFNRWVKWDNLDGFVIPVDVASSVTNGSTGGWQTGYSNDGLHQNRGGATRQAHVLETVLEPLIPVRDPFPANPNDAIQALPNPWNYMATPGALPASYTGTGTATFSTVARTDFINGTWMQIDTSAAAANTSLAGPGGGGISLASPFVVGAKVKFLVEVQIDPWVAFTSLGLGIQFRNSSGTALIGLGPLLNDNTWPIVQQSDRWSQGKTWIFSSPVTTIPATATAAKVIHGWNGQGIVRFGRQALILVP